MFLVIIVLLTLHPNLRQKIGLIRKDMNPIDPMSFRIVRAGSWTNLIPLFLPQKRSEIHFSSDNNKDQQRPGLLYAPTLLKTSLYTSTPFFLSLP